MIQIVIIRDQHGYWIKTFSAKECTRSEQFASEEALVLRIESLIPHLKQSKGL